MNNTESSLYDQLGGHAAVEAAVDVFYRKVLSDDRISEFFEGVDMDRQIGKQKAFLTMAFGGPHNYTGADMRRGHAHLVARGLKHAGGCAQQVIRFGGIAYQPLQGETVLDCLLRNDLAIPHSCKAGLCQSCLLRATEGVVPTTALKDTLVAQGYFLACACVPNGDVTVKQPERMSARIVALDRLSENVLRVRLHTDSRMPYFAGQFVNLFREDGLARSYSLASLPDEETLEIHVRRVRDGVISGWLFDEASPGTTIMLGGPSGDCFYVPGTPAERLLLAGSGTGLALLYGVIRDALTQGHTGEIRLFHGTGTYLHDELNAWAARYPNLLYAGNLADVEKAALAEMPTAKGWKAYLCGNPALVRSWRKRFFLSGMAAKSIHSDEFAPSATTLCS